MSVLPTVGDRLRAVSAQRLSEVVAELEAGAFFDLSDPDCPVAVRPCRGCRAELRFPFPDGVRPGLMRYLALAICESCAAEEVAAEERATGARDHERRVQDSRIPSALAAVATWESLIAKGRTADESNRRAEAIDAAREWAAAEKPNRGLLIWGEPGTGKTRLAATAAVERLKRWPVRWVSVGVLMAELDGAWNDDDRKQALKVITSATPAVLDDFDKLNPTGRTVSQLFAALDKREQARVPLIVTTNLPPRKLTEKLGDVIVSRLVGMCRVLAYPGPDHRLEIGERT
jgi:DNA replication protein DnaC